MKNFTIPKIRIISLFLLTYIFLTACENKTGVIRISGNKVQEGFFTAEALSPTVLHSNYPMLLENSFQQPILFKLSLNGKDNEGGFGMDHYLIVPEDVTEFHAPLLNFGQHAPKPAGEAPRLTQATNVHFRVDLRTILRTFEANGYYITQTRDTVYADSFHGLYLAGNTKPLKWVWDDPSNLESLRFEDADQDSIYEISIRFDPVTNDRPERRRELSRDLSSFPLFSSPEAPLLEALTNLALEEALLNIRNDGAFSAGAKWPGVWTRDISFAGQLSLAYLFPENMKSSLRAKLSQEGRIIQDTGTGGSWPISSDRHVWTLAAWEVFLATGDKDWLAEIREPVLQALKEDILWNRDPVSDLLLGETSFEDWREQTYPPWMSPADIHASHALSTNIIFKRALEIGLFLAEGQQDIIRSWPELITRLDHNILDHFWSEPLKAPASYTITAPTWIRASHRDLLGESLGILFCNTFSSVGSDLVASYPRTAYGSPIISHQLPHSPPYHNQAIWPFVEAYSLLAAKKAGNQKVYKHSFNSLIRAAALFQTHRENFHYTSGRPDQTEINSDRQLWSVAAWLGAVYKGLFGISISYDFSNDEFDLYLKPNNPFKWDDYALKQLLLHDTPISIRLKGRGSIIKTMVVNGQVHDAEAPLVLRGERLDILIELVEPQQTDGLEINFSDHTLPDIPQALWKGDTLIWSNHSSRSILEYNGLILDTLDHPMAILPDSLNGFFYLRSFDSTGALSLPCKPYYRGPSATLILKTQEPYYIEIGRTTAYIKLGFSLPETGNYLLRFIYSNGNGPINTGSTCGLAKLTINDWWLEQMVSFPHTATWDNWRYSAWIKAQFQAGKNSLRLDQESLPVNNMNGEENVFRVQAIEVIPVQP